jgi:hypothetical protein
MWNSVHSPGDVSFEIVGFDPLGRTPLLLFLAADSNRAARGRGTATDPRF